MKIKLPISQNIKQNMGIYLVALLIVPIVLGWAVILKTNPRPIEKFSIFVSGTYKDESGLKNDLLGNLPEDLAVYAHYCEENDSAFKTLLTSRGYSSDILLLTKEAIDSITDIRFVQIQSDNKYYFPDNYARDEKSYGISLNTNAYTYFNKYVNLIESKTYYVCLSSKSIHLEGFSSTYQSNQVMKVLSRIYSL